MAEQYYCSKCRRTMSETNFYTYRDGSKCELCKACLTMHVNNFDPSTFLWLLEKFDVPYIEGEWNTLRDRLYVKDPVKMNGMSVFGRYLGKMKLIQWNKYRWNDTEMLKLEAEEKAKLRGEPVEVPESELIAIREAYERGEISQAQYMTYMTPAPEPEKPQIELGPDGMPVGMSAQANSAKGEPGPNSPYPIGSNFEQVELVDVGADLTQEDKIYLAMKWGRLYTAEDWIYLEQMYTEMMGSFDIQDAARLNTLKMICKTSLKMNQAIDCGDIDGYQKLSRVFDQMMKQGNFAASQHKDDDGSSFDSVGSIVAFCEKEGGFIPRFYSPQPNDKVDETIADMKSYSRSLIYGDTALAQQIEDYIKMRKISDEVKEAKKNKGIGAEPDILSDEEISAFYEQEQQRREQDEELTAGAQVEEGADGE